MPEVRPIAACLGDSAKADFRLVLVLGREYNGSGSLSPQVVGRYCFLESPRSAFWNRTYSLISRACPDTVDFKAGCIAAELSPVVFSNVRPQPIPNERPGEHKQSIRSSIPESEVRDHVRALFGLPITQRFGVVILSVGDGLEFASAEDQVEVECAGRGLPLIKLPYLGSRASNNTVDAALDQEQANVLCSVVPEFVSAQDA